MADLIFLELEYLRQIDRTTVGSGEVIEELQRTIGLQISDTPFTQVISQALINTWTRDPTTASSPPRLPWDRTAC